MCVKLMCRNHGKDVPPPEAHPSGWNSTSCKQFLTRHFWKKTFLFQEQNLQNYSWFFLTANKPLGKTIAFKAVPGRRDSIAAYLMEIFPALPEIRNLMYFKGKPNFSMVAGFPDLRKEGKHFQWYSQHMSGKSGAN